MCARHIVMHLHIYIYIHTHTHTHTHTYIHIHIYACYIYPYTYFILYIIYYYSIYKHYSLLSIIIYTSFIYNIYYPQNLRERCHKDIIMSMLQIEKIMFRQIKQVACSLLAAKLESGFRHNSVHNPCCLTHRR